MQNDVLKFIPVSNLTEVRKHHPQGALAPQGDAITLARRLHQRMQVHKMGTEQGFERIAAGELAVNQQTLNKAHGLMDALGAIQMADRHQDTAFYDENKLVMPEGYEPMASFGTRRFLHVPYETNAAYQEGKNNGDFAERLEGQARERYALPESYDFNKGAVKSAGRHANVGSEGIINHPETGLQAGAFINHERKSVVIGFAGLNFEGNEMSDALITGGKRQYEAVQQEIKDLLQSGEIPDDYEVVFSGHSMGAAISQRAIYDVKQDPELRHVNARAINFDAPQVGNQIKDFDPACVKPEECINVNFTSTMGRIDFSKLPGNLYGGGHVGGGFYEMDVNFEGKEDIADLTADGKDKLGTKLKIARGMVNHQMINGVEALVSKHVMTGKDIPYVQTAKGQEHDRSDGLENGMDQEPAFSR